MLTLHGLPRSESAVTGLGAVLLFMRASSGGGLRFGATPLNAKRLKEIVELKREFRKLPLGFFFVCINFYSSDGSWQITQSSRKAARASLALTCAAVCSFEELVIEFCQKNDPFSFFSSFKTNVGLNPLHFQWLSFCHVWKTNTHNVPVCLLNWSVYQLAALNFLHSQSRDIFKSKQPFSSFSVSSGNLPG